MQININEKYRDLSFNSVLILAWAVIAVEGGSAIFFLGRQIYQALFYPKVELGSRWIAFFEGLTMSIHTISIAVVNCGVIFLVAAFFKNLQKRPVNSQILEKIAFILACGFLIRSLTLTIYNIQSILACNESILEGACTDFPNLLGYFYNGSTAIALAVLGVAILFSHQSLAKAINTKQ